MIEKIDVQRLSRQLVATVDETVKRCSLSSTGNSTSVNSGTMTKSDGSVVTVLDYELDQEIHALLQNGYSEFGFLSEEMPLGERTQVLASSDAGSAFWCLDPLDGTSNYASGIPFCCVSLALIDKKHSYIAIVYDFERGECFTAVRGLGAWLNGKKIRLEHTSEKLHQCMANIDFKRLDSLLALNLIKTQQVFRSQRNFGSCALEWCWLASGRLQIYLHGGMKLWDYAAGLLILEEAGGFAADLQGEAVFNPAQPKSSVVAAVNKPLFVVWRDHLARCSDETVK